MDKVRNPRHEYLDDTPRAIPLKFRRQSFVDNMREFIRQELSRQADSQGHETFEEADDFYIDDDDTLPRTQYELEADQEYYVPPPPAPAVEEKPPVTAGSAAPQAPSPAPGSPEPGVSGG